jgi:hypothetical protein
LDLKEATVEKPSIGLGRWQHHPKDVARRTRGRRRPRFKKRVKKNKHFDSTLGFPGEGPVTECSQAINCIVAGHYHKKRKGKALTGARRRKIEKQPRRRTTVEWQLCSFDTILNGCGEIAHAHDETQTLGSPATLALIEQREDQFQKYEADNARDDDIKNWYGNDYANCDREFSSSPVIHQVQDVVHFETPTTNNDLSGYNTDDDDSVEDHFVRPTKCSRPKKRWAPVVSEDPPVLDYQSFLEGNVGEWLEDNFDQKCSDDESAVIPFRPPMLRHRQELPDPPLFMEQAPVIDVFDTFEVEDETPWFPTLHYIWKPLKEQPDRDPQWYDAGYHGPMLECKYDAPSTESDLESVYDEKFVLEGKHGELHPDGNDTEVDDQKEWTPVTKNKTKNKNKQRFRDFLKIFSRRSVQKRIDNPPVSLVETGGQFERVTTTVYLEGAGRPGFWARVANRLFSFEESTVGSGLTHSFTNAPAATESFRRRYYFFADWFMFSSSQNRVHVDFYRRVGYGNKVEAVVFKNLVSDLISDPDLNKRLAYNNGKMQTSIKNIVSIAATRLNEQHNYLAVDPSAYVYSMMAVVNITVLKSAMMDATIVSNDSLNFR